MFENIMNFFKKFNKKEEKATNHSKEAAKERLHLVLMQDRANVSADFLELMKQEIIEVIKKYIDVDETAIDVKLTNQENGDGTNGAPALYANIPILNIKNEAKKSEVKEKEEKKEKTTKEGKEKETAKKTEIKETKKEEKEHKETKKVSDDIKEEKKEEDEKEDKQEDIIIDKDEKEKQQEKKEELTSEN